MITLFIALMPFRFYHIIFIYLPKLVPVHSKASRIILKSAISNVAVLHVLPVVQAGRSWDIFLHIVFCYWYSSVSLSTLYNWQDVLLLPQRTHLALSEWRVGTHTETVCACVADNGNSGLARSLFLCCYSTDITRFRSRFILNILSELVFIKNKGIFF